ncbi:MAG: hypothetical protein BWY02_02717 [bacterium ADurb.Bin157]|nr:MAG: hypothetical protein BWY02_02717 [bacterium ADurb.Bin157]
MENMENIIKVIEEASPSDGYTDEEIKNNFWNSPPPRKGYGRYLLQGKNISAADFAELKKNKEIWYWDRDYLEEMDMFYYTPGWRLDTRGIERLRKSGCAVEIDSIGQQQQRMAEAEELRKKKAIEEAEQRKKNKESYKAEIDEYENWLGNPHWVGDRGDRVGPDENVHIKTIRSANATLANDEYISYYLTSAGYLYSHRHYNFDMWDNIYSSEPAPAHVVEEAKKITEELNRKKEAEEIKRQEAKKKEIFVHLKCPRCGREIYVQKDRAESFKGVRCGKCHTGKKPTAKTTVVFDLVDKVERQNIAEGADIK